MTTFERELAELGFTRREIELTVALAANWKLCNKELAAELNVAESTIKQHFSHIHHKLNFAGAASSHDKRMQLVRWLWEKLPTKSEAL